MSDRMVAYAKLVERGCLCGTDRVADCPIHLAGDNRGIAAWFKAGMPNGFPTTASCAICGAPSLLYPSVPLDRGEVPAGSCPGPTLICPRCSKPAAERALVRDAEQFGHVLNSARIFGTEASRVAA